MGELGAELSAVLLVLRSAAQELLQQVLHGGQGDGLVQGCCGRHTQLIWARVTPEAVLAMRHISAPQLAGAAGAQRLAAGSAPHA